jgi:preprotein translocase subunit SecD
MMKQKVGGKAALVLVVIIVSVWSAFFKDVNLSETLKTRKVTYYMKKPAMVNGVLQPEEKADKFNLGLDLKGGVYVVIKATPLEKEISTTTQSAITEEQGVTPITLETMNILQEIMEKRINNLGVSEPVIQRSGNDRLIIEIPGIKNPDDAIKMMGKTATLEFKLQNEDGTYGEVLLTGKSLVKAEATVDQMGRAQIGFELDAPGAMTFAKITKDNIGKNLGIFLDKEMQTAPRIQSEIAGGKGVITGNYKFQEAKDMAAILNSGALPANVEIIETRVIGPTLGQESVDQSYRAGILALVLIGIYMLIIYRLPGIVANISLMIFGVIVFGVMNFLEATITLPGIAGFILSLGMAVDVNVLLFARMKEELQMGNTVLGAVDAGFKKAFMSIFDSNMTTLIITAVLFWLGTGPVRGFAIILTIGILVSLFTSITVSRMLLKGFIHLFKIENPIFFGVRR